MPMIPMYRPGGETIAELLLRQGEASARAAERSALLWGNAVSNIGNIAGGAVAQYQEQQQQRKQQEQRERMLDSALSTFDPQNPMDFYRRTAVALGPEPAMRATSAMVSLVKMQQEQKADPKDAAQVVGGLAALEGVTPGYLRKNWATVGPALKPVGAVFGIQLPDNPAELPEDFGQQIIALNQGLNKQTEQAGFTLSPGQVRYGPKGEILAQGPEAPAKPENLSAEEAFIRAQYGDKPTAQQLLEGRSRFAAAGREPDKPRDPNAPLSPTVESNIINRLSNQYTKAASTVSELSRQVNLMNTGLEAARRGDLAAGSQAVLVTFQKILDPTSVVRESEYARSAEGQALMARIEGAYEKLKSGGAGVPLSELEKYAKLGAEMTKAQMGSFNAAKERIGKTADRYRIPRELVIENMDYGAQTGPPSDSPKAGPKVGERRNFNGKVGVWDGKGWVKQ